MFENKIIYYNLRKFGYFTILFELKCTYCKVCTNTIIDLSDMNKENQEDQTRLKKDDKNVSSQVLRNYSFISG
jgi:hypothetical protein